jgi:glycosyltransferase involved in cell wall biosynthesis
MGPLRVLLANDTYPPQLNGAAIATQRLASGLAKRGHHIAVVAPSMSFKDETQTETTTEADVKIVIFRIRSFPTKPLHPQFRVTSWLGIIAKLEQIVHNFRPDIIHVQNHFVLGRGSLKVARKSGLPIVGTNHFMPDNLFEFIPSPLRASVSAVMWSHFLKTYNRLDCVIAPSYACLKMLKDVGLTAKARVVSNGIDLSKYQKVAPPDIIYQKYGIRRDCPVFLTVGRLEKDKKVDLVLKATAAASQNADFQTVVVGKGKDETEFRSLARKLGLGDNVVFTGLVPDEELPYLYGLANVYIGAGAAELQGMAVMEAMAAGLPVLAANAVALPELVKDRENGLLFSLDTADLTEKMLQMLSQRERWLRMGQQSLAYIQVHDVNNVLSQLEDLYRETIDAKRESLVG